MCRRIGFPINATSAKELAASLTTYADDEKYSNTVYPVLVHLLMKKAMMLAKYFCTGTVESEVDMSHYALNVPL